MSQQEEREALKPVKRSRSSTEGRLLQAGLEVFSELGFDAATTRMIAHRASTNEALIHRYFQSKKGLFDALVLKFTEQSEDLIDYPQGQSVEEELRNFLEHKMARILQSRDFLRILMGRAPMDQELSAKIRLEADAFLAARLRILQEQGKIRADIDTEEAAFNISFHAYAAIYMGQIVLGKDLTTSVNGFIDVFARGLRAEKEAEAVL